MNTRKVLPFVLAGSLLFQRPANAPTPVDNVNQEAVFEDLEDSEQFMHGVEQKRTGHYQDAISTFSNLEQQGCDDPLLYYYLAWTYAVKTPKETQKAIEYFARSIDAGITGQQKKETEDALCRMLGKHEPVSGCYMGAFIENSTEGGDIDDFEQRVGKEHASYINYVSYGSPFPKKWISDLKEHGAVPHIAFEPNNGLWEVDDDSYLIEWAKQARSSEIPIFLRFASEMNGNWTEYSGNPRLYKEKFRLVHDVMEKLAPNVAMVWVPFSLPRGNIMDYYPGDEYVDWAGVNIYSVYCHNGDANQLAYWEDPRNFLKFVYQRFADRKPIFVGEYAATHHCSVYGDMTDFALEKMTEFYSSLESDFPRVKAVFWFSYDADDKIGVDNRYGLCTDEDVLKTYRELVSDDYFLSSVTNPLKNLRN